MSSRLTLCNRFWFKPASPWQLGCCRLLFFAGFYSLYLARVDLRWHALFPDGFYQPRSFFVWLPVLPTTWDTLDLWVRLFECSVILSAVGLLTRLATILSFLLGLVLIGLQFNYGYLHWAHAVVPIVMGVLALAPCGDAVSLDALLRTYLTAKAPRAGGQYRWPVQLVRLIFVTVFCAAGLSKLRAAGLSWVTSDTLRYYLLENQYVFHADASASWGRLLANWLILHPGLCRVLAGLTLTLELSSPLALASYRARLVLIPALCLFQIGNALLLYQDFFFAYLGLYAFWVPWARVRRIIRQYVRWALSAG